tara:strand:- start:619 stop:765 length:147 start_codon:yes stop_codon:yes gene_type:complete
MAINPKEHKVEEEKGEKRNPVRKERNERVEEGERKVGRQKEKGNYIIY